MAITVRCSGCQKSLKVKDEVAGKLVKCPNCGKVERAPAAAVEPPPRPAKAQSKLEPVTEPAEESPEPAERRKKKRRKKEGASSSSRYGQVAATVGFVSLSCIGACLFSIFKFGLKLGLGLAMLGSGSDVSNENIVWSVALSADGKAALTGHEDHSVRLWDVDSGQEIRRFEGHQETVRSVALSRDGKRALSAGGADRDDGDIAKIDCQVRLWNVATGQLERSFTEHKQRVVSVVFSRDGARALSASVDGNIYVWETATGKRTRHLQTDGHLTCATLFPDGQRVLAGGSQADVLYWGAESGPARRLSGHIDMVDTVAISADGKRALTGDEEGMLLCWDLDTKPPSSKRLRSRDDVMGHAVILPDGKSALIGLGEGDLRLWNLDTGTAGRKFAGHSDVITGLAVSNDGSRAASCSIDGTVRIWDVSSGKEVRALAGSAKAKKSGRSRRATEEGVEVIDISE